jgi:hypothetical protein
MNKYQLFWYHCKWYWEEFKGIIILGIITTLWLATIILATNYSVQQKQFYKDEITILSDYIDEQETDLFNMSMVVDSVYSKQLMIEKEVISLAGEMHKIRTGK